MIYMPAKCSNCGAGLSPSEGQRVSRCAYCGTIAIAPEAIHPQTSQVLKAIHESITYLLTTDVRRLKSRWGNKPCSHPRFVKEYYKETPTGDFACTTCGETVAQILINCSFCDLALMFSVEMMFCPGCGEPIEL